jgi:DNA-binding transcriptional LysR family regulator
MQHKPTPETERLFARNLDWNLFKVFLEIVAAGGISAAARTLGRQQPTVSAALKRLEDHIGLQLCERTAQGVVLTGAGRALFDACQDMQGLVRTLPGALAQAAGAVEGTVTLRMISDLVSPELDAAMMAFHRAHPGVEIKLDVAPWRAIVQSVRAGDVEIGIACDSAPGTDLRYDPLLREVQQLYCGRHHPLFGTGPHGPAALVEEPFILTGEDEPDELSLFRRRHGLGRRIGGLAETLQEVRRLIQLGIGIGFLPTLVAEQVPSADLWPLLPEALLPTYPVFLVHRRQPALAPAADLLLKAILAEAGRALPEGAAAALAAMP